MLPDIGASELMVIALVALIFVGPKDLPVMLKKLGQFTSRMRRMASDFRTSFDDMARQSELDDLRREVEEMRGKAAGALQDPIGVNATLRETITDMNNSIEGPGVATAPTPEPAKPKTARKAPAAKAKAKPKTPSKDATPKAAGAPRKRAATKAST